MDTIVDLFEYGFTGFLSIMLNSALSIFDEELTNISETAFNIQDYLSSSIGLDFDLFYSATSSFGLYLIILKFLMKGFNVYILWSEGDSEMDPFILLTGFFKAIIITLTFNIIYDFVIDIPVDMLTYILGSINTIDFTMLSPGDLALLLIEKGSTFSIVMMIYVFIYIMLYLQFVKRGLEIFVLKVGLPLACVGLMDSDGGVFKPYIKKFVQEVFTVMIQVFFLKLSLAFMINGNILFGFAAISGSLKAPQFLQEFIMMYGGGQGVIQKTSQTIYMANMVKSFAK